MPKFGCWKECKQFEDDRACDSWAACGQGWEDVIRQVYATTAVGAIYGCKEWQDGVRGEVRVSAGSRSRVGSRSPSEKSSATTRMTENDREPQ